MHKHESCKPLQIVSIAFKYKPLNLTKMKYYKVKPQFDQKRKPTKRGYQILISNELYTEAELKRDKINTPDFLECFDIVNISSRKTYFFFGARKSIT